MGGGARRGAPRAPPRLASELFFAGALFPTFRRCPPGGSGPGLVGKGAEESPPFRVQRGGSEGAQPICIFVRCTAAVPKGRRARPRRA
eukprot:15466308-Alexandrium_andersonii.AAC.1